MVESFKLNRYSSVHTTAPNSHIRHSSSSALLILHGVIHFHSLKELMAEQETETMVENGTFQQSCASTTLRQYLGCHSYSFAMQNKKRFIVTYVRVHRHPQEQGRPQKDSMCILHPVLVNIASNTRNYLLIPLLFVVASLPMITTPSTAPTSVAAQTDNTTINTVQGRQRPACPYHQQDSPFCSGTQLKPV